MTELEKIALGAITDSYEGKVFARAYADGKPELRKAVDGVINVLRENRLSAAESIGLMEFMKFPILSGAEFHPKG